MLAQSLYVIVNIIVNFVDYFFDWGELYSSAYPLDRKIFNSTQNSSAIYYFLSSLAFWPDPSTVLIVLTSQIYQNVCALRHVH